MSAKISKRERALQALLASRALAVRGGLCTVLGELDRQTGEGFSDSEPRIAVAATEWDHSKNTIRLYDYEGCLGLSEDRLASIKSLGHWIYDANLTYTEIWTISEDDPPRRIWTVRDEIIERSFRLTTDTEGRMRLEQDIHAVGVHAQSAVDWALKDATAESVATTRCGKPKAGTVRLSLLFDRAAKQAIRLLAAAKDATDSAIVNEAISIYLTALTRGAAAPLRGRRGEAVDSQCGSGRSSYIIDSFNREAMKFLKCTKGYSFSDVARAAIAYRISLEDNGNSLRDISAELVRSQSDSRDERAADILSSEVTEKMSRVVRSIASGSTLASDAAA